MEIVVAVVGAVLGAVFGAIATYAFALRAQRQHQRYATTTELVSTFLAPQFMNHRRGVYQLSENVFTGKTTAEAVAAGFKFPIDETYYVGPEVGGVNLHSHLTAYFGWYMRVGYAIRSRSADVQGLQAQLSYELAWGAWVVRQVIDAIKSEVSADARETPGWVLLVDLVHEKLHVNTERPVTEELIERIRSRRERSTPMTWALPTWRGLYSLWARVRR